MNFLLHGQILGMPAWVVVMAVVGIGVVVYIIVKRRSGSSSSSGGVLGQNTSTTAPDPNLDPNTGIPYAVEEATDPNTGLPVYMSLLNQGNGMTSAPSPAPGASTLAPAPPQPVNPTPAPPQPAPPAPMVTADATSAQVAQPAGGMAPHPPQPGAGGGGGSKPGFAPHPPVPARGTGVPAAYAYQATDFWPYELMARPWEERA